MIGSGPCNEASSRNGLFTEAVTIRACLNRDRAYLLPMGQDQSSLQPQPLYYVASNYGARTGSFGFLFVPNSPILDTVLVHITLQIQKNTHERAELSWRHIWFNPLSVVPRRRYGMCGGRRASHVTRSSAYRAM
ncbi:hypothetical protein AYX14_04276 [Cryptococcus neoformans]|nr:hypothetical protein AYX14_04276 [Cryptococcus neoformans var. grubii]